MNQTFIGGEMIILSTGDLDPNRFARGYLGMETLKQAMLHHELIFRNQVRELHRLYWTQTNLMNELHQKWMDGTSSRVALTKCMGSTEEKNDISDSSCARENVALLEQLKCRPAEEVCNDVINYSFYLPADEFIRGTCVDIPYSHVVTEASKNNETVAAIEKDNGGCGFEEANEGFFGFRAPIKKGLGNSCVDTLLDHSRIIREDKPFLIDLNIPLEDENSHDRNDPAEEIILGNDQSNGAEASLIPHPSSSNSVTKARCDNQDDFLSRHGQDSKPYISPESNTNLPQSIILDSVNKLVSHEGSEEDTLSSDLIAPDDFRSRAPSRNFPTGCNSDDSVTTQLNSSQIDGSSMEKLMPIEEDSAIEAAAEVLMFFSSQNSATPIDHQPLHSSDSFELMNLHLSEVQTEDHLSIFKPSNPIETEKKTNGPRLRRGKGIRDFQKEILPGLASLARHEICEDLHNIGHKLRRTASRNAREGWFVPVQGRRSRLYSGRHRRI